MRRLQLRSWLRAKSGRWRDRRGAVAIMFALSLLPITMMVALAVDYSFYIQAQSQLNLASDAAAMHAVRVASQAYSNGLITVAAGQQAGQLAGQQWFQAQAGSVTDANVPAGNVSVTVTYTPAPSGFTATVAYSGTVATHIGQFILPSWNIANTSSAVITDAYLEIVMLLDNSSSMLIGATTNDIVALENATVCSKQSATAGQGMGNYAWNFASGYGYGSGLKVPQTTPVSGSCSATYTSPPANGPAAACFYIPTAVPAIPIDPKTGLCTNGGGVAGVPQAPCAFACHNDALGNDYYGLSQSLNPPVTLRLNVVQQAAANVIQSLAAEQDTPNQFSVGVYEFNNTLSQVYPPAGSGEAGTNLTSAMNAVNSLTAPLTVNAPNTYFTSAVNTLVAGLTPNGNGQSPATPTKNIFIVTDGMADYNGSAGRVMGPMTSATNEQTCQQFKNLGFTVYVLYTPYLPLPNPFYLTNDNGYVQPQSSSPVTQALQACASSPADFFQASDPAAINTAMQQMLASAINKPGRISH